MSVIEIYFKSKNGQFRVKMYLFVKIKKIITEMKVNFLAAKLNKTKKGALFQGPLTYKTF